MLSRPTLWVLALVVVSYAAEETEETKAIHRLVGGYKSSTEKQEIDPGLEAASTGGGREGRQQKLEDEEKKTLSQQVADGKYGLIQKELFSTPVKKPGVISYERNSEVPKDNIKNLGGLQKNEIWLAENHLLVLNGGSFPAHEDHPEHSPPVWPPIDDYSAPQRQVKLPSHPKVPPPFPVQLEEGGPLQLLGTNSSTTINGTLDPATFALPPPEGYVPGTGPFFPPLYPYPANATAGEAPFPGAPYPPSSDPGEYHPGNGPAPFPLPLNGTLPPYFASLPPGAAILPPPDNLTDTYDEDDPSIFYPPPYSFFYPKDNSTEVPPGPLVPGIILPPPPNFFAPLEGEKKKDGKQSKNTTRTRKPTTTTEPPQLHPPTTAIPPTSVIQKVAKVVTNVPKTTTKKQELKTTTPEVVTILPVRYKTTTVQTNVHQTTILKKKKPLSVTILKPVKHTFTPAPPIYYDNNEVSNNQPFAIYGPPGGRAIINTTQVPLKAYYSTSNEIDSNSVTENPSKAIYNRVSAKLIPKTTSIPAAQYYFYEEGGQTNDITSERPMRPSLPDPYISAQPTQNPEQIYYVTSKPRNTQRPSRYRYLQQTSKPDTFRIHIARLKQQLQSYVTPRPYQQRVPKPVYQYSFQAANYPTRVQQQQQYSNVQNNNEDSFKPLPKYSVQIQQAIEIIPPSQEPTYQNTPGYYQQQSSERPRYIQSQDYDYQEARQKYVSPVRQYLPQNQQKPAAYIVTPQPAAAAQYSYEATPNPIYNNFYTKPDEKYFDDITKKYFTIFGKKLPGAGTTPLPPVERQRPVYANTNQEYVQKPISLARDTLVNYLQPRPEENRDAEYIAIPSQVQKNNEQYVQPQSPTKTPKENVEIVKAQPYQNQNQDEKSGSYISYQLPGDDGAHFYFLTPQLVKRTDQGSGFYFSRKRRNEKER